MIGIERGWRLRREKAGTRVAGVRTYALVGAAGGLGGLLAGLIGPAIAAVLVAGVTGLLMIGFARDRLAGELLFGGVTRTLLTSCPISCRMCH